MDSILTTSLSTMSISSQNATPPSPIGRKKKQEEQNKIDVISIDRQIKKKLTDEMNSIPDIKLDISKLKAQLYGVTIYQDKKRIQTKINELELIVSNSQDNLKLAEYIYRTSEIVDEYEKLTSIPVSVNFFSTNTGDPNKQRKQELLQLFQDIAHEYIEIDSYRNSKADKVSCECGNTLEFTTDSNSVKCESCGQLRIIYCVQTSYKDIDRVNLSQKYKYKRKVHFRDTVNQYQGKQNKRIDSKVYNDLEEEFKKHNLLIDAPTFHERHAKITKEILLLFLSETHHNNHYEDVQLIHHYFTGIPCPDLSHIEEELYHDFDLVVDAFSKLEGLERLNFLNGSFVLYQLLKRHKYKVSEYEFDFLKTRERRLDHDELFARICLSLEWNMVYLT